MSSYLIYDRLFIKIETEGKNKYIPMCLAGCSNVYEIRGYSLRHRESRMRDWGNDFRFRHQDWLLDDKEFLSFLEKQNENNKIDYSGLKNRIITKNFTPKTMTSFYKRAFSSALTIEEIIDMTTFKYLEVSVCEKKDYDEKNQHTKQCKSSEEIIQLINELKDEQWLYCKFPGKDRKFFLKKVKK